LKFKHGSICTKSELRQKDLALMI